MRSGARVSAASVVCIFVRCVWAETWGRPPIAISHLDLVHTVASTDPRVRPLSTRLSRALSLLSGLMSRAQPAPHVRRERHISRARGRRVCRPRRAHPAHAPAPPAAVARAAAAMSGDPPPSRHSSHPHAHTQIRTRTHAHNHIARHTRRNADASAWSFATASGRAVPLALDASAAAALGLAVPLALDASAAARRLGGGRRRGIERQGNGKA